jgi:hypothetical protein
VNRRITFNSIIWTAVVLASAVILKGDDAFMPMLIVLISGAVASDAALFTRPQPDTQ